ncbi:MAG: DUF4382 domain-containing protein [Pseudomonadota bacterium]
MKNLRQVWAAKKTSAAITDTLVTIGIVMTIVLLSACGGSDSSVTEDQPTASVDDGLVYIGLTDAEGDFAAYTVDVLSLRLERANGTTVETLPLTTRVDFTELTEVTEFLNIATVPAGNYVAASVRLDFTEAQVVVQDESGEVAEALVIDEQGDPIGEYEVRLQLAETDVISIAPGVPAAFSLDFDLDASNTIDDSASPPVVTVAPLLLASAELEEDREHRVRGVVREVDEAAGEIALNVRPFFHRSGDFGAFTLNVDEQTQYEVDGQGYTGGEGLAAIAQLQDLVPVVANGKITGRSMMADIVIAGSSVPWSDAEVVKGVVTSRAGDTLNIAGASIEFADGSIRFAGDIAVVLGDGTTVSAPGVDNAELDTQSVSVGQRVIAYGEFADDQTLDATAGRIVMRISQFSGEVIDVQPMRADVFLLNGRRPLAFDLSGTGSSSEFDADLADYEIDTGSLSLNGVTAGDLVRVRGLVNAFGAAPADFNARTVIDVDTSRRAGELTVVWPQDAPSSTPFISTSQSSIAVDVTDSRELLKVRGIPRLFTNPLDMLTLLATESGQGTYAVRVRGDQSIILYRNFADLVDALQAELESGNALQRINARVGYTGDTDELTSVRASFVFRGLEDAE